LKGVDIINVEITGKLKKGKAVPLRNACAKGERI
jgi:hypothetical protein